MTTLRESLISGDTGHVADHIALHKTYNKAHSYMVTMDGVIVVRTGTLPIPIVTATTFTSVTARLGTAPTGSSVICQVIKNLSAGGTANLFLSGNRPTFTTGSKLTTKTPDVITAASGDWLTFNVEQKDSADIAADLCLILFYTIP